VAGHFVLKVSFMAELTLWLDSYDDIYSDFDSRHYYKRRISEDFLYELQREMKYIEDKASGLLLLLPAEQRNEAVEKSISGSLPGFFQKQFQHHQDKYRRKLNKGLIFLFGGIVIMLVNTWLNYRFGSSFQIPVISLKVLLEPAGWFLVWTAFDSLFYDLNPLKKDKDFYQSLSEIRVRFGSSEAIYRDESQEKK
jgi:hypothetical protein